MLKIVPTFQIWLMSVIDGCVLWAKTYQNTSEFNEQISSQIESVQCAMAWPEVRSKFYYLGVANVRIYIQSFMIHVPSIEVM